MPLYRVHGIPLAVATTVRDTLRAPQYGHPAPVEVATGYGPCRLCLQTTRWCRQLRRPLLRPARYSVQLAPAQTRRCPIGGGHGSWFRGVL